MIYGMHKFTAFKLIFRSLSDIRKNQGDSLITLYISKTQKKVSWSTKNAFSRDTKKFALSTRNFEILELSLRNGEKYSVSPEGSLPSGRVLTYSSYLNFQVSDTVESTGAFCLAKHFWRFAETAWICSLLL